MSLLINECKLQCLKCNTKMDPDCKLCIFCNEKINLFSHPHITIIKREHHFLIMCTCGVTLKLKHESCPVCKRSFYD